MPKLRKRHVKIMSVGFGIRTILHARLIKQRIAKMALYKTLKVVLHLIGGRVYDVFVARMLHTCITLYHHKNFTLKELYILGVNCISQKKDSIYWGSQFLSQSKRMPLLKPRVNFKSNLYRSFLYISVIQALHTLHPSQFEI